MSISINLGWSDTNNSYEAGKSAATKAEKNRPQKTINLALVFASSHYNQYKLIKGIKNVIPNIHIFGCSVASAIISDNIIEDGVVIAILSSDPSSFHYSHGLGEDVKTNSHLAGHQTAKMAINEFLRLSSKYESKRKYFIMFPEGVTGNGVDILRGCQEILGSNFPIVGGSAGDSYLFKKTYQYSAGKIISDSVIGLLVGGEIDLGVGIKHGWNPLGKYRKITKTHANIIKEIDNQPAISIYEEYFDEETKTLKKEPLSMMGMLYPIGMKIPDEKEYIVRNPFKIGEEGDLICTAELPEGSDIRLMIGNKDGVINAAKKATITALKNLGDKKPKFALVFDSISRKKLLGRNSYKEIEAIKNIIGHDVPLIGFYTYGEQAPFTSKIYTGQSYFHNESIVVTLLG